MIEDWIKKAVAEISEGCGRDCTNSDEELEAIIKKHCPFTQGVVYEEVTETSHKLDQILQLLRTLLRK